MVRPDKMGKEKTTSAFSNESIQSVENLIGYGKSKDEH